MGVRKDIEDIVSCIYAWFGCLETFLVPSLVGQSSFIEAFLIDLMCPAEEFVEEICPFLFLRITDHQIEVGVIVPIDGLEEEFVIL